MRHDDFRPEHDQRVALWAMGEMLFSLNLSDFVDMGLYPPADPRRHEAEEPLEPKRSLAERLKALWPPSKGMMTLMVSSFAIGVIGTATLL